MDDAPCNSHFPLPDVIKWWFSYQGVLPCLLCIKTFKKMRSLHEHMVQSREYDPIHECDLDVIENYLKLVEKCITCDTNINKDSQIHIQSLQIDSSYPKHMDVSNVPLMITSQSRSSSTIAGQRITNNGQSLFKRKLVIKLEKCDAKRTKQIQGCKNVTEHENVINNKYEKKESVSYHKNDADEQVIVIEPINDLHNNIKQENSLPDVDVKTMPEKVEVRQIPELPDKSDNSLQILSPSSISNSESETASQIEGVPPVVSSSVEPPPGSEDTSMMTAWCLPPCEAPFPLPTVIKWWYDTMKVLPCLQCTIKVETVDHLVQHMLISMEDKEHKCDYDIIMNYAQLVCKITNNESNNWKKHLHPFLGETPISPSVDVNQTSDKPSYSDSSVNFYKKEAVDDIYLSESSTTTSVPHPNEPKLNVPNMLPEIDPSSIDPDLNLPPSVSPVPLPKMIYWWYRNKQVLPCLMCTEKLPNIDSLSNHMRSLNRVKEKAHYCEPDVITRYIQLVNRTIDTDYEQPSHKRKSPPFIPQVCQNSTQQQSLLDQKGQRNANRSQTVTEPSPQGQTLKKTRIRRKPASKQITNFGEDAPRVGIMLDDRLVEYPAEVIDPEMDVIPVKSPLSVKQILEWWFHTLWCIPCLFCKRRYRSLPGVEEHMRAMAKGQVAKSWSEKEKVRQEVLSDLSFHKCSQNVIDSYMNLVRTVMSSKCHSKKPVYY